MQDYLLSHLLFEEAEEESQKRFRDENEPLQDSADNEVPLLDPDYVEEMEKLLALVENKANNKQKRGRQKKRSKPSVPKLKIFDMGNIKTKFEVTKQNSLNKPGVSRSASRELEAPPLFEENKSKVRGLFEGSNHTSKGAQKAGGPRSINTDLIKKFDCPETAARLRKQKEAEKEERKLRAQKEAERRRLEEEERRLKEEEERKRLEEEELKRRLQEEEEKRKREEEEKRLQLEKEAEAERQRIALEKERARIEAKAKLRQSQKEKESKRRSKKVLSRFQHLLESPTVEDDKSTDTKVGHIDADNFFTELYADSSDKKPSSFQDSSLSGVSLMMHKAKRKLEATDGAEKPVLLKRTGEKRRQLNVAAVGFELKQQLLDNEELISARAKVPKQEKEWSYKKRTAAENAMQSSQTELNSDCKKSEQTSSDCAQEDDTSTSAKDNSAFLEDLHEISSRMQTRNTEEEQERKMEEHARFLEEIQGYLSEPVLPEDDPFSCLMLMDDKNEKARLKTTKKSKATLAPLTLTSVGQIKSQLSLSDETDSSYKDKSSQQASQNGNNYVKGLQQQLWGGDESDNSKKKTLTLSRSEGRLVDLVGKTLLKKQDQNCPTSTIPAPRNKVPRKIIPMPENTSSVEAIPVSQQCDWKYKRKQTPEIKIDNSESAFEPQSSIQVKHSDGIKVEEEVQSARRKKGGKTDPAEEEKKGEDLKEMSSRLLKTAREEQDKRMEEHARFMEEIQGFLNEPLPSQDNPFLCLIEDETKATTLNKTSKPKTAISPISVTSVGKIKSKLIKSDTKGSAIKDNEPCQQSSRKGNSCYVKGLQQQLWGADEDNLDKDHKKKSLAASKSEGQLVELVGKSLLKKQVQESFPNPAPRSKVPKKIIPMPENSFVETTTTTATAVPRQCDWTYKKKTMPQVQVAVDAEQSAAETSVRVDTGNSNDCGRDVEEVKPEEGPTEVQEIDDSRTADFDQIMEELDDFLTSPSRKNEPEEDYKEEIGRFLALIETTPKKKAKKAHLRKAPPKKLQKLRSNLLKAWESSAQQDEKEVNSLSPIESKYVGELRDRLEQELSGKSTAKREEIRVATVGASVIKKTYEKMTKDPEVSLLGPRTCRLKVGVEDVLAEDGVRTLEEIKAQRERQQWKWKEKQLEELHSVIAARNQAAEEEQEEIEDDGAAGDVEERDRETIVPNIKDISEIERDRHRKDMEFEEFLSEIKDVLARDGDEEADYLAMLQEEEERQREEWEVEERRRQNLTKLDCTSETRRPRVLLRTGGDLASRMETLQRSESGDRTVARAVGKLDPDLLESAVNATNDGRRDVSPKRQIGSIDKHLLRQMEEETPNPAPRRQKVPKKVIDISMFDKSLSNDSNTLNRKTEPDKKVWKWKQKQINELMESKALVPDKISPDSVEEYFGNQQDVKSKDEHGHEMFLDCDDNDINASENLHLKQLSKETAKVALLRDVLQKGTTEAPSNGCAWALENRGRIDPNLLRSLEGKEDQDETSKSTPKIRITQFSDDACLRKGGKTMAEKGRPASDSFSTLKNIMKLARDSEVSRAFAASKDYFDKPPADTVAQESQGEKMKTSQTKRSVATMREKLMSKEETCGTSRLTPSSRPARSKSCANMRRQFESLEGQQRSSDIDVRWRPEGSNRGDGDRSRSLNRSKSTRVRRHTRMAMPIQSNKNLDVFDAGEEWRSSSQERAGAGPLVKNRSFSKFRDAFEKGDVSKLRDEDGDGDGEAQHQNMGVKAELQALKHCPRLQNLLRINRPQECPPKRSPRTRRRAQSGLDLDEETMEEVSKSRAAIKNMLESTTAPKITFGASLRKAESSEHLGAPRRRMPRKVDPSFTERKWVFDAINKYFDVIKEEKEEDATGMAEQTGSMTSSVQSFGDNLTAGSNAPLQSSKSFWTGEKNLDGEQGVEQDEGEINRFKLSQSKSSGKLRDMVTSIISR